MRLPVTTLRLARASLLLLVVGVLAACNITTVVSGPREWTAEAEGVDGSKTSITVRDTSGRLTNVEINPVGVSANEISNEAPNVVLVPWTAGACDTSTVIEFAAAGQGLAGTLDITTSGDICTMQAIPQVLRLTSDAPLPADQVMLVPAA